MSDPKKNVFNLDDEPQPQELPAFQVPPPATATPGITGNPPLPPGQAVTVPMPSGMTAKDYTSEELATLSSIPGWSPGDAVPENLAQVLAEISHDARGETTDPSQIPLPVAEDTPPLIIPQAIDISQLPPEKQREVAALLDHAQVKKAEAAQRPVNLDGAGPGINEAIAGQSVREVEIEDDRGATTYAGTDIPQSGLDSLPESRTGADQPLIVECPRCGWDLKEPDPVQPSMVDKQSYLMATAGGMLFQREYELFGGRMSVTFRELRPYEADEVFKQAYHERSEGKIQNPQEFFETLMRLRICLQLVVLVNADGANHFPSELKEWRGQPDKGEVTILPKVLEKIYKEAIRTESLNRVLSKALGHFNRMVNKLEENWYRPDFWEETEQAGSSPKPLSAE